MRVISGKYKGQNLVSFNADHIRPTTDRVKESMFNMLQFYLPEARVLDLFSGTGNLGIEALSRGADSVCFVEKSKKSIEILKKNLQKIKVEEDYSIIPKDVLSFLKSFEGDAYDVIFADPPFTEMMAHDVMLGISKSKVLKSDTVIAIESGRREKVEKDYDSLVMYDQREFGDKFLSLFKAKDSD